MMTFAFVAYTVVQSRQISGWAMVLALLVSVVIMGLVTTYSDMAPGRRVLRERFVIALIVALGIATVLSAPVWAVYFPYDCSEAYWWEYYCWRIFSLQWLVG